MDVIRSGTGPMPVVALHGIQGTRAAWMPLAEALGDVATFILPNLRGRGAAVRGAGPDDYGFDAYVSDLRQVIEAHVPAGDFVLAGWSMGVSVALAYLGTPGVRRPRGLFLLSGTADMPSAPWFKETEAEALLREIREREVRLGLKEAADHEAVAATWQAIRGHRHLGSLSAITEPVRIVHGREDADSPWSHALQLAAGLPDASLIGLGQAGHSVLTQNTEQVATALRDFLLTPPLSMKERS